MHTWGAVTYRNNMSVFVLCRCVGILKLYGLLPTSSTAVLSRLDCVVFLREITRVTDETLRARRVQPHAPQRNPGGQCGSYDLPTPALLMMARAVRAGAVLICTLFSPNKIIFALCVLRMLLCGMFVGRSVNSTFSVRCVWPCGAGDQGSNNGPVAGEA